MPRFAHLLTVVGLCMATLLGSSAAVQQTSSGLTHRMLLSYVSSRQAYREEQIHLATERESARGTQRSRAGKQGRKERFVVGPRRGRKFLSPAPSLAESPSLPPTAIPLLPPSSPAQPSPSPPLPSPPPPPPAPQTSVAQPKGGLPDFEQIFQCPDGSNVKRWGAKGDKIANDADAIIKANKDLRFLYFPPGIYRIATSITITKPIIAGLGAYFWVDEGRVLTITAQPHHWSAKAAMFAGPGRVRLAGQNLEVYPDWFKGSGEDDSDALQKAADSCVGPCTIMLTRNFYVPRPWHVQAKMGSFATNAGIIWPGASSNGSGLNPGGVVVRPGTYNLPLIFSGVRSFSGYGIKIQGGVDKVEIQAGHVSYCGDGILFAPNEGSARVIRNVEFSHISVMQANQNAVAFAATETSQVLNNVVVRGNFNLMGGFEKPEAQSASVLFRGVPPTLVNTSVVWQAVDPAQFDKKTNFTMLQSVAEGPVTHFQFGCETWAGGFEVPGKLVHGNFNKLAAMIFMAGPLVPSHMYQPTGDSNFVSLGAVGGPDKIYVLPAEKFNTTYDLGEPMMNQAFFVRVPVEGIWPPGQIRTFYFDSMFALTAGGRMKCSPFRGNNMGITCAGFDRQPELGSFRVALKLKNSASYAVPSWQQNSVYMGIQVGP